MVATGFLDGSSKSILVCDDERHLARLLQVNFESQGYKVTCAFDGAEAIGILESNGTDYGIAILDWMMPVFDGLEVLKWIRSNSETQAMRVILLVPASFDRKLLESLPYQADMVFDKTNTKPWDYLL